MKMQDSPNLKGGDALDTSNMKPMGDARMAMKIADGGGSPDSG